MENREIKEIKGGTILNGPEVGELSVGNTVVFHLVENMAIGVDEDETVQITKMEKRDDGTFFIQGLLYSGKTEERVCEVVYDPKGYEVEGGDYYGELKVLP